MTELVLAATLVAVLLWHMWTERQNALERKRLLAAIVAKNSLEYVSLDPPTEPRRIPKRDADPPIRQFGA